MENVQWGPSRDLTIVHRVIGRSFVGTNPSPLLSLKCTFGGAASYFVDDGPHRTVDDGRFLILNEGHGYTVQKDTDRPMETFCLFFPSGFVTELAVQANAEPLEDPIPSGRRTTEFYEQSRPHKGGLSRRLLRFRQQVIQGNVDDDLLQEALLLLADDLLKDHRAIAAHISDLPWARPATRVELFRRVHVGRDYLHGHLDHPFSLEKTARAAMLSRYHFHRAFERIIGETPLKYMQRIRLERARYRLSTGAASITDIAFEVGYSSVAAFSSFFRAHEGMSPSAFRRCLRANKQYR